MKKAGPTLYLLAHAIVAFLCGAITGLPIVFFVGFLFLIAAFFAHRLLNEEGQDDRRVPAARRAPAVPQEQAEQPGQSTTNDAMADVPADKEDELAEQVEHLQRTVEGLTKEVERLRGLESSGSTEDAEEAAPRQSTSAMVEPDRAATSNVWVARAGNQNIATLKCIRKYGKLDLEGAKNVQRNGAPCVVAEEDVEEFVREMEALGNVVSREPVSSSAVPDSKPEAAVGPASMPKPEILPDPPAPRPMIDPSTPDLQWTTDADDLFAHAAVTGHPSGPLAEIWCDARGQDASYVLERMGAWGKATSKPLRWFVVLDRLTGTAEPKVVELVGTSHPHWEVSWVLQEGFVRGAALWSHADAPAGMWYAPLEDTHYLTRFVPEKCAPANDRCLCLVTEKLKENVRGVPYDDKEHVTYKHVWWRDGLETRRYATLSRNDEEGFLHFLADQGVESQYMRVVEDHDMYEEHESASSDDFMKLVDNGTIARIYGTWYLRAIYRGAMVELWQEYPNLHHGIRVSFMQDVLETVAPLLEAIEDRYCYERIYLALG